MHSIHWGKVQNQIQYGSAAISTILNSILIVLILKKSPKKIGAYKYLMICVSIFEIFYSVMDVIVSPVFHSHGSSFILYIDLRRTLFNRETILVLHAIYAGCFGFSMAIFGIHFIYRYMVATGNKILIKFNNWKVITWFVVPMAYGIIWASVSYFLCGPSDAANKYVKNNILETFDIKVEDLTYLGVFLYPTDENGQNYISPKPAIGMGILIVEIATSLVTIIYFASKCFVRINALFRLPTYSAQRAGLQSQLFLALVTQTLIPVLLMHIPVGVVFFFTLLDAELGMACGIVSITIALYPAIDPLPTLFIVKSYRTGLYEYFDGVRKFKCCQILRKNE